MDFADWSREISRRPEDWQVVMVFADWLEDQGYAGWARRVRLRGEVARSKLREGRLGLWKARARRTRRDVRQVWRERAEQQVIQKEEMRK